MCLVQIDSRPNQTNHGGRIPTTLQNVFLASNRGLEVNAPPPQRAADKVFRRGILGRTYSSESSDGKRGRMLAGKQPSFALRFWGKDTRLLGKSTPVVSKSSRNVTQILPLAPKKKVHAVVPTLSPQQYLDAMVSARGYNVKPHATLSSAYYNKPTPLQLASYGTYIVDLVKSGNHQELQVALASGLSSNPCNAFGESLLHNICRRGDAKLLNVLLEAGCDVQVSDDCGRTPLHNVCWAAQPAFDMVERLLERDVHLLYMADGRGSLPLAYVRKEHWSEWLQFLQSKKDVYWPRGAPVDASPSPLAVQPPHTRPVPSPDVPLSLDLAAMVANGRMTPDEAQLLATSETPDESDDDCDDESDEDFSDSSSSYDESTSSDEDDAAFSDDVSPASTELACTEDDSWNEDEMNDILNSLTSSERRPLVW